MSDDHRNDDDRKYDRAVSVQQLTAEARDSRDHPSMIRRDTDGALVRLSDAPLHDRINTVGHALHTGIMPALAAVHRHVHESPDVPLSDTERELMAVIAITLRQFAAMLAGDELAYARLNRERADMIEAHILSSHPSDGPSH